MEQDEVDDMAEHGPVDQIADRAAEDEREAEMRARCGLDAPGATARRRKTMMASVSAISIRSLKNDRKEKAMP